MSLASKLLSASGGVDTLFSDDVFQSFTRTGTGADATVTTGIDMTKGFMLWSKGRSGATDHAIYDSARGPTFDLACNTTAAQTTQATGLKSVSATGHTVGSLGKMNTSGATYVDFVFRRAPKFFDIVTYTGDGVIGRQIPHALGIAPGMFILKSTSDAGQPWWVYHRKANAGGVDGNAYLLLNTSHAVGIENGAIWGDGNVHIPPTSSVLTVGNSNVNQNGVTYVVYLFAHDPSVTDGIIQCGSYSGAASGTIPITLGWEPQYVLTKLINGTGGWIIHDTTRGITTGGNDPFIYAQTSGAENDVNNLITVNATGFAMTAGFTETGFNGNTYIYLAIRRPNKPPTTGTQVYNAIARTGTGAAATVTGVGFAPDLALVQTRSNVYGNKTLDRLRNAMLESYATTAEASSAALVTAWGVDGFSVGTDAYINNGGSTYINHFFKRAVGVFDEVCYSVTTQAPLTINHSLDAIPELVIIKARATDAGVGSQGWGVFFWGASAQRARLHVDHAGFTSTSITSRTSKTFVTGNDNEVNAPNSTYVAYLFATLPAVSKVGTYTGNGTTQTIPCGFTTGARFILIKRTDAVGDWKIFDHARGIISANDPHLALNTTAAEITTDDSVDPAASGFIVNEVAATNLNVLNGQYIFLAIS